MYSFPKTLPDGRVVYPCKPRMLNLRANITYRCDRGCPNCNRACGVAKSSTDEDMKLEQFQKVMEDSIASKKLWTKIVFTGGEPSMHPDLIGFCQAAVEYKEKVNPEVCNIWIATYHHPKFFPRVEEAIKAFPIVKIMGDAKVKPRIHNYATYLAPCDEGKLPADHYYRGCHLNASLCGCTVDYKGFYPCPVAPAIARVFNLDFATPDLANASMEALVDQYDVACRLCGYYTGSRAGDVSEPKSKSWEDALKSYADKRKK